MCKVYLFYVVNYKRFIVLLVSFTALYRERLKLDFIDNNKLTEILVVNRQFSPELSSFSFKYIHYLLLIVIFFSFRLPNDICEFKNKSSRFCDIK